MSLTLHLHPLSSYCHKVLTGLYELGVPFEKHVVDLGNPGERAALAKLWPIGKFPVLYDHASDVAIPESTIILEYVDARRPGKLLPRDPERARACRLQDRFYDLYVHAPMQKIVGDRLRPEASRDPYGVAEAEAQLEKSYAIADDRIREGAWALGDALTLGDCAAAPALFFANKVAPFAAHRHLAAYFDALSARPSYARVLEEAKPFLAMFPG